MVWSNQDRKEYMKLYRQSDKYKLYIKQYKESDKYKLYNQRPEVKAYRRSEKYKARVKEYRKLNKHKVAKWSYSWRQRKKDLVYNHYGGYKCALCPESRPECLSIDHINGGGKKHIKEIGNDILLWLVRNKFPEGFRILCMNCNHSLGRVKHLEYIEEKQNVNTM